MGRFFGLIVGSATEYIRLQAWLNSTPENATQTRRSIHQASALISIEPEPNAVWLVNDALECGLTFEMRSVSWQEIEAWQTVTHKKGIWLAQTVKKLSENYIDEFMMSNNTTKASPIQADSVEQRQAVSTQFKSIFRGS